MTDKEKIKAEVDRLGKELVNGSGGLILGRTVHRYFNKVISFIDSLPEEPVSEDLEEVADKYSDKVYEKNKDKKNPDWNSYSDGYEDAICSHIADAVIYGANWQKNNLWKDAQSDDLPEIGREVIVLQEFFQGMRKVGFAHRPNPNGWYGKSLGSSKVEHFEPKTYDKGGWNKKGVIYWLDVELPKDIK